MPLNRFSLRWFIVLTATCCICLQAAHGQQQSTVETRTVQLGIITLYHPLVMYRNYQPFADYLTEKTPYRFELKITESYAHIIDFLQKGQIQAAILGGKTYLEARHQTDIVPVVAALGENGQPQCQGVFITRNDNPDIKAISDLAGKKFAFASIHSTSGNLMPLYHLYNRTDIRLDDFSAHENLKYHDSVVREVLRGNFDAGVALDTIANQYRDVGLKIVAETDPFPGFVLVTRKDADPQIVETIQSTLLALDYGNAEDRQTMKAWDVNIRYGFVSATDQDYDGIRRALDYLLANGIDLR